MLAKKLMSAVQESGGVKESTVVATYYRNTIDLWEISTGDNLLNIYDTGLGSINEQPYSGLQISPDNSFIITSSSNGLSVFDLSDGSLLYRGGRAASIPSISPDGSKIAIMYDNNESIAIIETANWTVEHLIPNPFLTENGGFIFAWSPDGTKLAIADLKPTLLILETATWTLWSNKITLLGEAYTLEFSNDSSILAVSQDRKDPTYPISFMNVEQTLSLDSYGGIPEKDSNAYGLSFTPDGLSVVINLSTTSNCTRRYLLSNLATPIVISNNHSLRGITCDVSNLGGYTAVGSDSSNQYFGLLTTDDLEDVVGFPTDLLTGSNCAGVAFNHPQ